jgi:hypothetical protein
MSSSETPQHASSTPPVDETTTASTEWQPVGHIHLPHPTYWPAVLAFGITLLSWGIITSWLIALIGGLVFMLAIGGWIGDLLYDNE